MRRTSEKKHWDHFWTASSDLDDVYGTDERIIENLKKHVDLEGSKILEVGAGSGRDAGVLGSLGAEAVALDYSEASLNLMRKSMGSPFHVVCGDALRLPFCNGSFDVVFHQGLLEHFRNPEDLLDENVRVLKKGGVLLVDVPQRYHYYTILKHFLMSIGKWFAGWETEFSVRELTRLVESRGMRVIGVYGHNMFPPIWYRGMRRVLLEIGLRLPMLLGQPAWVTRFRRRIRSIIPKKLYLNTAMVIGCIARK